MTIVILNARSESDGLPGHTMSNRMRPLALGALLLIAVVLHGGASAQSAGSSAVVSVALPSSTGPVSGWSVQHGLLGRAVYDDQHKKIGRVEDMLVTSASAPYVLVISVGGFVGLGEHSVAVPLADVVEQGDQLQLPGATKASLKAMPHYVYASAAALRAQFIADASKQLSEANAQLALLRKEAATAKGTAKSDIEKSHAMLQADIKTAEGKLTELKKAESAQWAALKEDVSKAIARVKAALSRAPAPATVGAGSPYAAKPVDVVS